MTMTRSQLRKVSELVPGDLVIKSDPSYRCAWFVLSIVKDINDVAVTWSSVWGQENKIFTFRYDKDYAIPNEVTRVENDLLDPASQDRLA